MVSCSVVALDWVDLTNVLSGIFISSVTGSILIKAFEVKNIYCSNLLHFIAVDNFVLSTQQMCSE